MKHAFYAVLSLILISCGNTSAPDLSFKKQPPDTILTTIQYAFRWDYSDYRTATAQKIIKDTFDLIAIDSITQRRKMVRDSFYFVQLLDTVRDAKGIVLDSLGNPKMEAKLFNVPRQIILQDFNRRWGK